VRDGTAEEREGNGHRERLLHGAKDRRARGVRQPA
jgi:hypothetical protein